MTDVGPMSRSRTITHSNHALLYRRVVELFVITTVNSFIILATCRIIITIMEEVLYCGHCWSKFDANINNSIQLVSNLPA